MGKGQRHLRENGGHTVHDAMNLVGFGFLFYAIVAPAGFVIRWLRRDLLKLRFDPEAASYWIRRVPPGPSRSSMKDQYGGRA